MRFEEVRGCGGSVRDVEALEVTRGHYLEMLLEPALFDDTD